MPPNAADAAKLTAEQGADLVAHILKSNRFPAGKADFAAADAATGTIGWPSAPTAGEQPPNVAARYPPTGTVNQLMRSIFFHNANLLFAVQEVDPKDLPGLPIVGQARGAHDLRSGSQDVHRMAGGRKRRHRTRRCVDAVDAAWASVPKRSAGSDCRAGLDPIHGSDGSPPPGECIGSRRCGTRRRSRSSRSNSPTAAMRAIQVYRNDGGRGRGRGANPGAASAVARCMHR